MALSMIIKALYRKNIRIGWMIAPPSRCYQKFN